MLRLYNISQNVNEVLLFRQLKHTEACAVHVFKNSNRNNKDYALVSFKNQQETVQAQKYNIKYYNTKLIQESLEIATNEVYYSEEEDQEEYYKHNQRIVNFKKRDLTLSKQDLPHEKERLNLLERNRVRNKIYTRPKKEKALSIEGRNKELRKENNYANSLIYMAQRIQNLEGKLSNFESNWGLETPNHS